MRLTDLEPKLVGTVERGVLTFFCPYPGHGHKLRVPLTGGPAGEIDGVRHWHAEGTFPDTLTLTPSIDADGPSRRRKLNPGPCWHGFVTDGEVR